MKKIFLWTGILGFLAGTYYFLVVVQCKPNKAALTARSFLACLASKNLKAAYDLTIQKDDMGKDPQEFESIVKRQLGETRFNSVQLRSVFPFQSYGNRLRRWLRGQEVEMPQISFNYHVDGLPFEIREVYTGTNSWKISYIQSHAE